MADWIKVFDGFSDGANVAQAWDGTVYQIATEKDTGRIDRYDWATNTWHLVKKFDTPDTGKEGRGHYLVLNADGSALVGLATREDGQPCIKTKVVDGICTPAPVLPDDLFDKPYGNTNAAVMGDDQLGLRIERQRRVVRAWLTQMFATGKARRAK